MRSRATVLVVATALAALTAARDAHAQVSGTVFLDRNGNGRRDAGEPGVSGVAVSNQDAVTLTDASGHYALPAGGFGNVFVSTPRNHRAARWWAPAQPGAAVDFALVARSEPAAVTFVQASDTHVSPASAARTRRMLQVVDSIAPSFLLVTGDLVRDALRVGEAEAAGYYALFDSLTNAAKTPVFTVPGNHENFGIERALSHVDPSHPLVGRGMYRKLRGPDFYSYNAGGAHFVALNSVDIDDQWYYGHVDAAQLAWLAHDLATVPDSVPVVTFNHIPFASTAEGLNGYTPDGVAPSVISIAGKPQYRHVVSNVKEVLAALGAHRLEIALGGHVHFRETIGLRSGNRAIRIHQTGATVSDGGAGPWTSPSSVTVYTIRNGVVDDGRVVPLGLPR